MTPFQDDVFPAAVSYGASGGPEWRVEITELANGFEVPNLPWADSRRRYNAGIGLRNLTDLRRVQAFFEARRGRFYGFAWIDHGDFSSLGPDMQPKESPTPLDQRIGTGDGATTEFQLIKTYGSESPDPYIREIRLPILSSVRVAVDGAEVAPDSITRPGGVIALPVAPDPGAIVTAGFEFHVPVRFDTDRLDITVAQFNAGEIPSIPVVEVRL